MFYMILNESSKVLLHSINLNESISEYFRISNCQPFPDPQISIAVIDNEAQIPLQTIYDKFAELHSQLSTHPEVTPRVYDNKSLMSLLRVKDRYLKRLRDNGLLGYSRHGDKYWYTQADVDRFLTRCHFAPFALR